MNGALPSADDAATIRILFRHLKDLRVGILPDGHERHGPGSGVRLAVHSALPKATDP
jgi:hypothetical protein